MHESLLPVAVIFFPSYFRLLLRENNEIQPEIVLYFEDFKYRFVTPCLYGGRF